MGSATSSGRRCSSDATVNRGARHLMKSCDVCGWPKLWTRTTEDDYGRRGFAHRRCLAGALDWGKRNGTRIRADRLRCPTTTADFGAQTDEVSTTVAAIGGDSVDRIPVATCDFACGDFDIRYADGWTITNVASCEIASGNNMVYLDGCTQTNVATCEVASGDETVYLDGCTQTNVVTCEVASGDDSVSLDGCTQTNVATTGVTSDIKPVHSDGFAQADVAICHVASGVGAAYVNVPAPTSNTVVRKKPGTMADEMAQMVDVDTDVVVPAALLAEAKSILSSGTEPRSLKADTQESTLHRTHKYWKLRFALFSKFDEGIMLDEASMYSVCPEVLAQHMANKCSFGTVLDPFCGAGGNAIQLALTCNHVIAIDLDPKKIALARKNAEIYGVAHRIDFRVGDSFLVAANLRVDAVVTSPPWGGPGYERRADFNPRDLCSRESGGMAAILRMARAVAPRVVLHVPKNIDKTQSLKIAMNEGFSRILYEGVTIDRKPNCINLYLTRNDTHSRGTPVQMFKTVQLYTPTLNGRQRMERIRTDNMNSYKSYLNKVAHFLDA